MLVPVCADVQPPGSGSEAGDRAADVRLLCPSANFNRLLRHAWLLPQGHYFVDRDVYYALFVYMLCWHINQGWRVVVKVQDT